ncbi:MAG: hypothetical protein IH988_02700 [Planctomycetes bacterium]|nr:hypothetical protein [Planctomycetota bacterium]
MNINLHIERLILDGVPLARSLRPSLQDSIEVELVNLLATNGLAPGLLTGSAMPQVRGGSIRLTSQVSPSDLGQQIAQAVYRGIGR